MDRKVRFSTKARKGLKQGVDELANAVKVTLGPKGRIVVFDDPYTGVHATKDGVTIAGEIKPDSNIKKMGAKILLEAASKTADLAGDGTTTATVLAQAMVARGIRNVESGANPVDLKRGMDKALKLIVAQVKELSQEVGEDNDKIKQVATISANNDEFIGQLIAEVYAKIGNNGFISVEEAKGSETYHDIVQGIEFDKGYLSPYFMTDSDSKQVLYDNVGIIICEDKISEFSEVNSLVSYSIQNPILLICDDMTTEVLASIVMAKLRQKAKIVVVKSPYYGIKRKHALEDISKLTGSYVISKEKGYSLSSFTKNMLGGAEKCIITNTNTVIVNGHGKEDVIKNHVSYLNDCIDSKLSTLEKEKLKERISKLTNGVAVLYAGAASEVEMKEKKDRLDDALEATKAAIAEGIVPGGGVALLRAMKNINILSEMNNDTFDQQVGAKIVLDACKAPILQIASNSGVSGEVIINNILSNEDLFYGYDFKTDEYSNMFDAGIVDPTKVTRVALENAVSVAGIIIMTECTLVNIGNQEEGLPEFLK